MEQVRDYYKKFVNVGYDKNGILNKFELCPPDNYNFAYDIIDKYGELEPERRALQWVNIKGEERVFTYSDLSRLSNQAANLFLSMGIKKGDMVMLVLKRNYQFWYSIMGLTKIGAIVIPATHLLTTHDFVYRFKAAGVKAIVATADNPEVSFYVDEAEKEMGENLSAKFITNGTKDGWVDFDEEIKKQPETLTRIPTDSHEYMLMYFTSGTTGYPKMVIHTHRYALAHIQTAHWHNVDPDGTHLTIADTGWGKAVWGKLYGQMSMGSCVFVYDFDKFVPADMLRIIQDYKITTFCAPPTMFRFFIKEGIEGYNLSNLKYATIAGEALNPEVFYRWKEYTGIKLMEGFGQTESTLMLANLIGMEPKPGSMGKPTPLYDIVLLNDEDKPVPVGETGEICVRAERGKDGLFDCYYRDEEKTNKAWHDGFYHTGDTAWMDEDGYYWYVGRNDDVIKSSGYRIGPFEIESVLISHPAVLECAITGAPDPIRGQVVKATIVLTKGYTASDELKKELQTFVKKNTAPYKYPRIVEFVDELPKTISGKIRRAHIRETDNKTTEK